MRSPNYLLILSDLGFDCNDDVEILSGKYFRMTTTYNNLHSSHYNYLLRTSM